MTQRNLTINQFYSPSSIKKVSVDEMIAIMRKKSGSSFVPAVLYNNRECIPILAKIQW